ncbi:peptidoglycan DD-metalloendopeptidase family protein [Streptomyces sp. IF17]|nr:M23 family metallopeptidase [Streptomyces alkaliphilus]MQS09361.1 peptidoglycan DD-metalloendopeptidase family protein [Streptomyces alkaliphilus]
MTSPWNTSRAPRTRRRSGRRLGVGRRVTAGALAALVLGCGAPGIAHAGSAGDRSPLEPPTSVPPEADRNRDPEGPGGPDRHRSREGVAAPAPAGGRDAGRVARILRAGHPVALPGLPGAPIAAPVPVAGAESVPRRVDRSARGPRFDPFAAPGAGPFPGWVPGAAGPSRPAGGDPGERWTAPVEGHPVSAAYGTPGEWQAGYHTGVDFAVPEGEPVVSVGPGTVVLAEETDAYGRVVTVEMVDGHRTLYAHLSRLDARAGDRVTGGVPIGLSGNTGRSSGPHLHFEVREGVEYGTDVDPVAYLRSRGVDLG